MKILFISSGNTKAGISPIIKSQGQSLLNLGNDISFFTIKGKGFWSYLHHIFILRKLLKNHNFDIVHSHYSSSSFVASLAGAKPLVVSLMGSDLLSNRYERKLILFFQKLFWNQTIVKSEGMYQFIASDKTKIIPNGIDLEIFRPYDKKICQDKLGWDNKKRHLLFAANPERPEKNFALFKMSLVFLTINNKIEIHTLKNIPHNDIPLYMNASDVIILSSFHEGSPNVIKEAMSCNRPIVTTNVGDVKWVFGNTDGCFISSYDPVEFAAKIKLSLEFSESQNTTKGRERIVEIGLDSVTIAEKIISIYQHVLNI